jgi:uncharacterized protein GlcG (DUF336 family)
MLTRMDGAAPVTAQIATEKGRSAAVSRRSTKVSVSGVQSHEDELICSAGIAALD